MVIGKTLARSVGIRQRKGRLGEKRPVAIQGVPETDSGVKLEGVQLIARVVEAIDLGKSLQPGVAATLSHNAIQSPRRQSIIKTFVGRTERL